MACKSKIYQKNILNYKSRDNFKVLDGDEIFLNAHPNIVKVLGEVNTPGTYKYYPKKSVRQYLAMSGGLTVKAERKEIWVANVDGTSKKVKRFWFSPVVLDGSVITVGQEEETEPIDKTEFAKEIASIIADFTQIALTLAILYNTTSGG